MIQNPLGARFAKRQLAK